MHWCQSVLSISVCRFPVKDISGRVVPLQSHYSIFVTNRDVDIGGGFLNVMRKYQFLLRLLDDVVGFMCFLVSAAGCVSHVSGLVMCASVRVLKDVWWLSLHPPISAQFSTEAASAVQRGSSGLGLSAIFVSVLGLAIHQAVTVS